MTMKIHICTPWWEFDGGEDGDSFICGGINDVNQPVIIYGRCVDGTYKYTNWDHLNRAYSDYKLIRIVGDDVQDKLTTSIMKYSSISFVVVSPKEIIDRYMAYVVEYKEKYNK